MTYHRYAALDRELTESALARRISLAALAAATYSEKLDRLIDVGTALATRVRFKELVAAGQWSNAIRILRRVPDDFPFLDRVFIADRRGTVMADTPELAGSRGVNFAHRDWYRGVSREWKPYVSGLYRRGAVPQRNVIAAAVPIQGTGGKITGVLVLQVKLESYFEWAKQLDFGPEDRVMVVDADGRVAFDTQAAAPMPGGVASADATPRIALPAAAGADIMPAAEGGEDLVRVFAPASHRWGVLVVQSARAAFAARDALLRQLAIDGVLVALFAIAAIVLGGAVITKAERQKADEAYRAELEGNQETLERQAERLKIVHQIDQAIITSAQPETIAAAVIEPLRDLLGVPRAIVNLFDLATGQVEWLAAAGRKRIRAGPGVRYSIRLMGDVDALRRGEPQRIDVRALPAGADAAALLASGVHYFLAVPMIAGGELIGALSFGGERDEFPPEQVTIAQEVAAQLAIAIFQARLFERVKESERRFSDLLGNVKLVSVMLDRDARITYCNEHLLQLTGWSSDDVIGRNWVELFIPPESGSLKERLPVLFSESPAGRHGDHEIVTRSGERRLIRWNNSLLRAASGEVTGLASIGEDITERRRAEREIQALNASLERRVAERTAQLEAANKELESFTYSVSHDLRAPLRAVDGYAQMLEEDHAAKLDGEGQRLLGVVRGEAKRMGQLIDDLLEFSRMGRQTPMKQTVDMVALAREVAEELCGGAAPAAQVGPLPPAPADRAMLRQVWLNLVGNARKYAGKRGDPRIEIGGHANGAENVYWVRDNGVGFDMRYVGKLFGVFQRLHRADEFPGTGVGLAIVQRVVSRHGGRVWAEGKPGEGACFYFSLPKEA